MDGTLRSTLLPPTGPAAAQRPALSQTVRLFVAASDCSKPSGTLVFRLKLASVALASPDSASCAVQRMLTLALCQRPSAVEQVIVGGSWSDEVQVESTVFDSIPPTDARISS